MKLISKKSSKTKSNSIINCESTVKIERLLQKELLSKDKL